MIPKGAFAHQPVKSCVCKVDHWYIFSGFFFMLNNVSVVYCSPCSNFIMRLITHNNNCILNLLQNHLHSNSKIFSLLIIYYLQFTACNDEIYVCKIVRRESWLNLSPPPRVTKYCFSHSCDVFWRSGCLRWIWRLLLHYGSSFQFLLELFYDPQF